MNENEIVDIEVFPEGGKVTIQIDSNLYKRLQQLIFSALPFKDMEHFTNCIKEIKSGEIKDPLAYHASTLMHLCNLIEEKAREEKIATKKKFDLSKGSVID